MRHSWHGEALAELKQGRIQINTQHYCIEGQNPWVRCPDRKKELPMIMGRRYLFARMYAEANMDYIGTLNRHYHVVHMAKAARLGYLPQDEVLRTLQDWVHKNPYLEGINWSDCLNHAIRIVNWCIIFALLNLKTIDAKLAGSLHQQGTFIEKHLSFGSSAANHLLGELWGLFFLSHCFPNLPRAKHWQTLSVRGIENEIRRQFTTDGLHVERSISYHRYILEYLLLVFASAKNFGVNLSAGFVRKVQSALDAMTEFLNPSGEASLFGDCGHEITTDIHYLSFWQDDLFASVLKMGDVVLGKSKWGRYVKMGHEDTRLPWLFDYASGAGIHLPQNSSPQRSSTAMADSGFFILRDGEKFTQESSLSIRCGPMGFGPLCAHAHADMLSFVLSVRGRQFIIDPGTYSYHLGGDKWRQFFRSTKAHNTLCVDGRNQADSGGAMIWLSKASGQLVTWGSGSNGVKFEGLHTGYLRLKDSPGVHRRKVNLNRDEALFDIFDHIVSKFPVPVTIHYHFHPNVKLRRVDGNRFLAIRDGDSILLVVSPSCDIKVVNGDNQVPQGWYSPFFAIKVPTQTLILRQTMNPDSPLWTRIHLRSADHLPPSNLSNDQDLIQ
jgi:uncharacterized heparinase superfamily protein